MSLAVMGGYAPVHYSGRDAVDLAWLVKTYLERTEMSEDALSAATGRRVKQSTVHRIKSGETLNPRYDTIIALLDAMNVTFSQFANEDVPEMFGLEIVQTPAMVGETSAEYDDYEGVEIQLISWDQADEWRRAEDPCPPGAENRTAKFFNRLGPRAVALRIQGDSMVNPEGAPSFPEGAVIAADPDLAGRAAHRDLVVAKLNPRNKAVFRQLIIENGTRYLKPLNPRYQIVEVEESCTIIALVVATAETSLR